MSHGDGQDWSGATTALAAPPPKSGNGTVNALRIAPATESLRSAASQWELLFRGVSPAQQADLLALASQQGLLYGHQLPPASSMRYTSPADDPRTWNLLGKILAGQLSALDPNRADPVQVCDAALDETQRYAVAAALGTPDICLIQGLPGTGKSRVVAEIVTQAAQRGDRILLLANHPAALDRVLEQVAGRESLCPIRCVAPQEQIAELPPAVRALTFQERTLAIRQNTVRTARDTRQAAELQCARRRYQEPLWPRLEELARTLAQASETLAQAELKLAGTPSEVAAELEAATGRVAQEMRKLERSAVEKLAQLAKEIEAAESERTLQNSQLAEVDGQIAVIQPLAVAKEGGRWWRAAWWKALFQGDVRARLQQMQAERQSHQAALEAASKRRQALADARQTTEDQTVCARQAILQAEIDSRQRKLRSVIEQQRADLARQSALWADLCRQLDLDAPSLTQTVDAVLAGREQWQKHRLEDEARCNFAREWAEYLESNSEAVAARLPGYVNLVAATPAALAGDPQFGDAAAAVGAFDLLILEEAEHLAESDFLKAARRARRWVLVGEPSLLSDQPAGLSPPHGPRSAGAGRSQCFHQLWQRLHCDPSTLPYQWFRESTRLGCRLRLLSAEQRKCLEIETVADAPDVELRILALPQTRPVLAEVLFAGATTVPAAKEFLFRELQEIPVQTSSRGLRWSMTPPTMALHFTATPEAAQVVNLDNGVREYLAGPNFDQTSKLEFACTAGWDLAAVENWVDQHLHLRDLGRTVLLEHPYRMTATLAGVVYDLFGLEMPAGGPAPTCHAETAVEFIAVTGPAKQKATSRNDGRVSRKAEASACGLPPTGAGLETDLAGVRQGDRLASELRSLVPGSGYVNLQEARAVVRKLETLLHKTPLANGSAGCSPSALAVVALFPGQVALIRQLILQSPLLAAHANALAVGLPAAFHHREAETVIVSLTRSHIRRAVSYGERPTALMSALARARRRLILVGDPGNLYRRSQWRGGLDHLDEAAANREAELIGQLVRYLQGQGRHQQAFSLCEGSVA